MVPRRIPFPSFYLRRVGGALAICLGCLVIGASLIQAGRLQDANCTPQNHRTTLFVEVWGYVTPATAGPAGAIVTAHRPDGAQVGCFRVTVPGAFGLMRIYGLDANTPGAPGLVDGDQVTFRVEGFSVSALPQDEWDLIWQSARDNRQIYHVDLQAETVSTPTSTPSPTASATPTQSPTPSTTPTLTLTFTPTPTPSATHTSATTSTPTPTSTPTTTPSPTPPDIAAPTPSPTTTFTPSPTSTSIATHTPTASPAPPHGYSLWLEAEAGAVSEPLYIIADTTASSCAAVLTTLGWTGGDVTLQFTVPLSADYYVWARVRGAGWKRNSFWVSIDNATPYHYEIPPFGDDWIWGWDLVHADGETPAPIHLSLGTHTLRFGGREPDTRLDAVLITEEAEYIPSNAITCVPAPSPTPTATPQPYLHQIEAETGLISYPLAIISDPHASGCQAVMTTRGWSGGEVSLNFEVPVPGNYYLWARVRGAGWKRNSFWVSIDNATPYHYEIPPHDGEWTWTWDRIHPDDQDPTPLYLTARQHRLQFTGREPDAALDAILIVDSENYAPDGDVTCPATTTPTASPTTSPTVTPSDTPTPPSIATPSPTPTHTPSRTATPTLVPQQPFATPTPGKSRLWLPLYFRP